MTNQQKKLLIGLIPSKEIFWNIRVDWDVPISLDVALASLNFVHSQVNTWAMVSADETNEVIAASVDRRLVKTV